MDSSSTLSSTLSSTFVLDKDKEIKEQVAEIFCDDLSSSNACTLDKIIDILIEHCCAPYTDTLDANKSLLASILWINSQTNRIYYGEDDALDLPHCTRCTQIFKYVNKQLVKHMREEEDKDAAILARLDKIEELIKEIKQLL